MDAWKVLTTLAVGGLAVKGGKRWLTNAAAEADAGFRDSVVGVVADALHELDKVPVEEGRKRASDAIIKNDASLICPVFAADLAFQRTAANVVRVSVVIWFGCGFSGTS